MSDDWITEWLTPAQAAQLTGMQRETVYYWIRSGYVQARRNFLDDSRVMVNRDSLLAHCPPRCPTCTCLVDYHGQTCALCQFVAAGPYHRLRPMPVHPAAASNHDCRNHLEDQ